MPTRAAPATRRNLRIAHANMADDTGNDNLADLFVREMIFTASTPADMRRAKPLTELRTVSNGRPAGIGRVLALEITAKLGMLLEEAL